MSIVVIGNAGQLSFELVRILGEDTICLGPEDTDITNESVLSETLSKLAPSVIINAAAYTAVDKAEEDFDLCHAINATAVENLAKYCKQSGAFLVHVSTVTKVRLTSLMTLLSHKGFTVKPKLMAKKPCWNYCLTQVA